MRKNATIIIIVLAIIICIFAFIQSMRIQNAPAGAEQANGGTTTGQIKTATTSTSGAGAATTTAGMQAYSASDVAKHSTKTDCFVIIDGKVYDATRVIANYSGIESSMIALGCGKDDTTLFKSWLAANPQTANAVQSGMEAYYIGDLKS
jgi:cytochrome b involved in lipid metabolism